MHFIGKGVARAFMAASVLGCGFLEVVPAKASTFDLALTGSAVEGVLFNASTVNSNTNATRSQKTTPKGGGGVASVISGAGGGTTSGPNVGNGGTTKQDGGITSLLNGSDAGTMGGADAGPAKNSDGRDEYADYSGSYGSGDDNIFSGLMAFDNKNELFHFGLGDLSDLNVASFSNPGLGRKYGDPGSLHVSATPIPPALPLFATGLGLLGLFAWNRTRKNSSPRTH
jgi:hypothetical protein